MHLQGHINKRIDLTEQLALVLGEACGLIGIQRSLCGRAMSATLCMSLSGMSVSARRPLPVLRAPLVQSRPVPQRGALIATEAQNTKRRQRRSVRETAYNRQWISLVKSSSRAVVRGYKEMFQDLSGIKEEGDLQPVDKLLSVAFKNVDKAVSKGVLHKSTGARRKAKLTAWRKAVLAETGIFVPAPENKATPQLAFKKKRQ
jgi:small subunit ribosomal protein S20